MNTKDIIDHNEALKFVNELAESGNTVDVVKTADGKFRINWVENKKYIALDGKEYNDEVWTKEDGTMILCQDLELAHARNIIRMIVRNDREDRKHLATLEQLVLETMAGIAEETDAIEHTEARVLH